MRITIDANEANVESPVGTGQYARALISRWHKEQSHNFALLLRDAPLPLLPEEASNWHYRVIGPRPAWSRLALPWYLATHKPDGVFFGPAHYLPPYLGSPSVVTIHDLAYEFFPELFTPGDLYKLRRWTRRAVAAASRVIAVSASTKRDLIRLYETPCDKITVIPNGYDADIFNTTLPARKSLIDQWSLRPGNYILYLGTIQPRKNIIRLVQAFHLLKKSGYQGKLVIAGKVGWLAERTLAAIAASPDRADIVQTGYISDDVRVALYRHAEVFVLPSLYEGFGVGLLEAMASGCPVVAANNSSLPEVVGDAGLYFDPGDPKAIAEAITRVRRTRGEWQKRGLTQAKSFSWDKCAAATLEAISTTPKLAVQ